MMKSLTLLHDKKKLSQNQREKIVYTKFSLIPPMAGDREPDVSWVSAKKKIKLE